jgi:hypothetical protein
VESEGETYTGFWWGKAERKRALGRPKRDGRIILKPILKDREFDSCC